MIHRKQKNGGDSRTVVIKVFLVYELLLRSTLESQGHRTDVNDIIDPFIDSHGECEGERHTREGEQRCVRTVPERREWLHIVL